MRGNLEGNGAQSDLENWLGTAKKTDAAVEL